jgi:hypothetical protein
LNPRDLGVGLVIRVAPQDFHQGATAAGGEVEDQGGDEEGEGDDTPDDHPAVLLPHRLEPQDYYADHHGDGLLRKEDLKQAEHLSDPGYGSHSGIPLAWSGSGSDKKASKTMTATRARSQRPSSGAFCRRKTSSATLPKGRASRPLTSQGRCRDHLVTTIFM